MLPADQRLTSPVSFREVVRRGHRCGGALLVVYLRPGVNPGSARVGMAVSKAVGNAVVRNKVKRRLRHLVREHVAALPSGTQVVVRAAPAAASATYLELGAELERCLSGALDKAASRSSVAAS